MRKINENNIIKSRNSEINELKKYFDVCYYYYFGETPFS